MAMDWRTARSLDTLLAQLNARAPKRSKASDGSIGDTSHQNRSSDHNPWFGPGIVTARDFTHDPAGGLDCNWLATQLVASRDPRIKYLIWNNRILDSRTGNRPWQWVTYSGANPHTKHLHLSVVDNSSCDDTTPWNLGTEADMTPDESRMLKALYDGLYLGGPSTPGKRPFGTLIGQTADQVQALFDGVYKGGPSTPGGRPLAALIGEAAAPSGAPTDEQVAALADRLRAELGADLAAELGRRLSQAA